MMNTSRAVLSDIHSNIDALEAVLSDIQKKGITRIICLGDVIGYGPCPAEVLKKAQDFEFTLMGNHDEAIIRDTVAQEMTPLAFDAIQWTKKVLEQSGSEYLDFLAALPFTHHEEDFLFSHGDFNGNRVYLDTYSKAIKSFEKMEKAGIQILFVGHTHRQGHISRKKKTFLRKQREVLFKEIKDDLLIVNPGSVGQPRDRNPTASYAIVDSEGIHFQRVKYDVRLCARRIFRIKELDPYLAERLLTGV